MSELKPVLLQHAKDQVSMFMKSLSNAEQRELISFMFQQAKPDCGDCGHNCANESGHDLDLNELDNSVDSDIIHDPIYLLNKISSDIKERVPFSAILPSENIVPPKSGENADCDPNITLHVDEFLYNDDDVTELADNGKLNKHYCRDCGSKNIAPLSIIIFFLLSILCYTLLHIRAFYIHFTVSVFISHSMSREALHYVFNTLLPTLKGKTVLDIGSRLGAVLYGAYVYTDARKIIGVEMNEEFCQLQRDIVKEYKMGDRVEVLHKRIEEALDVVETSDVIVIHNPFEFYLPEPAQVEIWKMLRASMKKGTLLVTSPHMETTFEHLDTGISLNDWLMPYVQTKPDCYELSFLNIEFSDDGDKFSSDIACYEVL